MTAQHVVIAVGTRPTRPAGVDFDERRVIDSDGLLDLEHVTGQTLSVVGAGVIGVEYASMFAAIGTRVTPIDTREKLFSFPDREVAVALEFSLRKRNVSSRFGEQVIGVRRDADRVVATLRSGKQIASDALVSTTGRQGVTDGLQLARAGLQADDRGRLDVDADYR